MEKYYSLKKIDKTGALYRVILGKRSNGKTYAIFKKSLQEHNKTGARIAYIRRWDTDLKPKEISRLLSPHDINKIFGGAYNKYKYQNRSFYLYHENDEHDIDLIQETPFCQCFALNTWEHSKGADNGHFDIIFLDEMLTRGAYLPDEFVIFTNVLSSLLRDRDGSIIYMVGNTVNQFNCPYFSEMGLKHIKSMSQGDVDIYTYSEGLTVAVEYAPDTSNTKKINKYFAFDNPRLNMITNGTWEIRNYPRLNMKYTQDNVIIKFFIEFDNERLQGDLVCMNNNYFCYVYPNKRGKQFTNSDIVFTFNVPSSPLHVGTIHNTPTRAHSIIRDCFVTNRIYYSDNNTGEIVRNWLIAQRKINANNLA